MLSPSSALSRGSNTILLHHKYIGQSRFLPLPPPPQQRRRRLDADGVWQRRGRSTTQMTPWCRQLSTMVTAPQRRWRLKILMAPCHRQWSTTQTASCRQRLTMQRAINDADNGWQHRRQLTTQTTVDNADNNWWRRWWSTMQTTINGTDNNWRCRQQLTMQMTIDNVDNDRQCRQRLDADVGQWHWRCVNADDGGHWQCRQRLHSIFPPPPNSPLIQCLPYPVPVLTLLQIRLVWSILVSSPWIVQPYLLFKPLVAKWNHPSLRAWVNASLSNQQPSQQRWMQNNILPWVWLPVPSLTTLYHCILLHPPQC